MEARPALTGVPWQIWVVVAVLALEGILGNLPDALSMPIALWWFAWKILFITGLLKRWRWVFVLFVAISILHVIAFLGTPVVASINLFLMILTLSAQKFYFPRSVVEVNQES